MKSRTLSFNVLRETMKRQIWIPALITLGFFLCLPVAGTIAMGWQHSRGAAQAVLEEFYVAFLAGSKLPFYGMMTIGSAVLTGVSGFSWLHSRQKTDFYHSLPMRREKIFVTQIILDVAYFAVPFLVNLLLAYAVGAASGIMSGRAVKASLASFLFQTIFYLLIYFVVVLGMLLSGKVLTGIVAAMVLLFYGPVIDGVLQGMAATFFETYANRGFFFTKFFRSLSPVVKYIQMYSLRNCPSMSGKALAVSIVVIAVLAALCFCLYKNRPSEAAGRTLAFYKIGKALQYMIEVLVILGFGIIFYNAAAQMKNGWMIFGILLGAFLSHGIQEVIQEGDIRQVMAHKWVLTASLATSLLVFGIFYGDLFRYDDFLPEQGKLKAMRIKTDSWGIDDIADAQHNEEQMAAMERMASDPAVYEMLRHFQKNQVPREKLEDMARGSIRTLYVEVEYVLSGGSTVYRNYLVDYESCRQQLLSLAGSPDYKTSVYPLVTLTDKEMTDRMEGVNITSISGDEAELPGNDEMRAEFLKIYRGELLQMTGEELEKEYPIGSMRLEAKWNYEDEAADGSNIRYSMLSNREYFIYPSFTRTLAWLEEKEIELPESFRLEDIEEVTLYKPAEGDKTDSEIIRDKKEIEKMLPYLVSDEIDDGMKAETDYVSADLLVKEDGYSQNISCRLLKSKEALDKE